MKDHLVCPNCGKIVEKYRNPFPTVDIIIEIDPGYSAKGTPSSGPSIVLIQRRNPPFGWAIPGGFVDYGESLESAAKREAAEETSLEVGLLYQLGAYSDPSRDPRHHTISVVFVARTTGTPRAADDAADIGIFDQDCLPDPLAFDHKRILSDYFKQWHSDG
jgi:ADP-ribose pyrophosphatase YjhB (NUDIX family)